MSNKTWNGRVCTAGMLTHPFLSPTPTQTTTPVHPYTCYMSIWPLQNRMVRKTRRRNVILRSGNRGPYPGPASSNELNWTELQGEVRGLRLQNDALEQYGRRSSLRITGISETCEDTTAAVVALANDVLQLDPKLEEKDIDISHRLPKPRSAKEEDPRPVIVRFMTRKDRRRVITERSKLKNHNKDNGTKIYINEDLTTHRAGLFRTVRKLLAQKHFNTAWTFNGNIKVTTRDNVVKSITTIDDIKAL